MKFLSFNNFFYIVVSLLLTQACFSDSQYGKYVAVFFLFYGLFIINYRLSLLQQQNEENKNALPRV